MDDIFLNGCIYNGFPRSSFFVILCIWQIFACLHAAKIGY